jgi:SAM-dependent methyltransferase
MAQSPPRIFSPARRRAVRLRMRALQQRPAAPRYIMDDMVEDVLDRLGFLRHEPARALVIGEWTGQLAAALRAQGAAVTEFDPLDIDEEQPLPPARLESDGFDFIASLGTLDTVNDLPGAMIHLRSALAPGGLMIASFMGAGSLPVLRAAMQEADGERPAGRIHPQVDVRAGGQLLQRCGYADPVVDSRPLKVRLSAVQVLLEDLRAQGLGSVLVRPGPPLGKAARTRLETAFTAAAGSDGRVTETFEILTLSGWKNNYFSAACAAESRAIGTR